MDSVASDLQVFPLKIRLRHSPLSTLHSPLSTINYSHTPSGVKSKKQKCQNRQLHIIDLQEIQDNVLFLFRFYRHVTCFTILWHPEGVGHILPRYQFRY
ncbi:MAG: hypothetical protein LBE12_05815 [Planctomycetaceae bacterium]|nr:hypothetical protein [Planctomycetaceae bacterium]